MLYSRPCEWGYMEGLRVQIETIVAIFDWFFKQQANFLLVVSDWYCEKPGLTDLPGHDVKLTPDMNLALR